ncbi:hypothetical protein L873DRAFT_158421 [Choiromyces venosus 120613-1]|uniref:Uncharacterized protein n=1 Tax=Choiromyces venosus 120613-1 TaxID=1336337 RepID=A0A3N4JFK6_9PEZI|nr:hypothetical protein L873DRAFT_158421 [Choiromyces venosus 120613-1]
MFSLFHLLLDGLPVCIRYENMDRLEICCCAVGTVDTARQSENSGGMITIVDVILLASFPVPPTANLTAVILYVIRVRLPQYGRIRYHTRRFTR